MYLSLITYFELGNQQTILDKLTNDQTQQKILFYHTNYLYVTDGRQ